AGCGRVRAGAAATAAPGAGRRRRHHRGGAAGRHLVRGPPIRGGERRRGVVRGGRPLAARHPAGGEPAGGGGGDHGAEGVGLDGGPWRRSPRARTDGTCLSTGLVPSPGSQRRRRRFEWVWGRRCVGGSGASRVRRPRRTGRCSSTSTTWPR